MTTAYIIQDAIRKEELDRIHPCRYYQGDCCMVQVDQLPYIRFTDPAIAKLWDQLTPGECHVHKKQLEQIVGR